MKKMKKMKISEWMKQKRKEAGLSVSALANRVGCSATPIGSTERERIIPFKSINDVAPYRPGETLMTSIAAQFEKSLKDVYNETDYKDLTVKKKGFGHKHPNRISTTTENACKMQNIVTSTNKKVLNSELPPSDNSYPQIKFFIIRQSVGALPVIVKECDNIDFAKGYMSAFDKSNIKLFQGYLKEVLIK